MTKRDPSDLTGGAWDDSQLRLGKQPQSSASTPTDVLMLRRLSQIAELLARIEALLREQASHDPMAMLEKALMAQYEEREQEDDYFGPG